VIRRNRITGDGVLVAPARAQRPNASGFDAVEVCPFCPGHENETPPEVAHDGEPWRIRVFPNKYPASDDHEVIVESADHDAHFDDLSAEHAARVTEMWFERFHTMMAKRPRSVTLFKNDGRSAGASIDHVHSQILAAPFVPQRLLREGYAFACATRCPLCALDDEPVVAESEHYRVITPRGATFAYEQWIIPREHRPTMHEPHDLATLLQPAARASSELARAFNWAFLNFRHEANAHWYVVVAPRLGGLAAYEVGFGGGMNMIDAEDAAAALQRQYSSYRTARA